ncbi:MAG TPA: aspartate carbamoyltransferase [Candidatus Bathyarchaeia archaeon]|nr:aspartate carbamoyltransferase [Candidatus Bathyarchaeia archaeon]
MKDLEFAGQDVISMLSFTRKDLEHLFTVSNRMIPIAQGKRKSRILEGKNLGVLFYEPSTRTRISFEAAMNYLGGGVTGFANQNVTRASGTGGEPKEELDDMIRVVEKYVNVIVIRSLTEGSAKTAADYAKIPVINGGDGVTEHPTQAMLDLFTIMKEKGKIDGLRIVQLGNIARARSAKSFALAASVFNIDLTLASPRESSFSDQLLEKIENRLGQKPQIVNDADPVPYMKDADVVRVNTGPYTVDLAMLKKLNPNVTILHPLPRGPEIAREVDETPNAAYFRQAFYGMVTRMALLALVLGRIK